MRHVSIALVVFGLQQVSPQALAGECSPRGAPPGQRQPSCASAIIVSLDPRAAYELTSPEDGVLFDIDGDGTVERVAWTRADADVAFLAIDRDGDGRITSGSELFGTRTVPGSPSGFDALQRMAMETNGGMRRASVSADDPLFANLWLWTDTNHDGTSDSSELTSARGLVSDVGVGYQRRTRRDAFGNVFRFRGWVHVRTAPGRNRVESAAANQARTRSIYEVCLRTIR